MPVNAIIPLSRSVLLTGFPCHIIFLFLAMFSIALFKKGYERIAIKNVQDVYTQEIGYEPRFYEVDVAGGTRELFE